MSGIQIIVDDRPALAMIARLQAAGVDMGTFYADVAESLIISTRARAERQVDPDGAPWVQLEPTYRAWKKRKRPGRKILVFDFHMLGDRLVASSGPNFAQVGSTAVYAAIQQGGGIAGRRAPSARSMAARRKRNDQRVFQRPVIKRRPFIGLSQEDSASIIAKAKKYLRNAALGSA